MMGIVFTELLDHATDELGLRAVESALARVEGEVSGAYTKVGNYSHQELLTLVTALAKEADTTVGALLSSFTHRLFLVFLALPEAKGVSHDTFGLLSALGPVIHSAVRKMYPEGSPPDFECRNEGDVLYLSYRSRRCLAAFARMMVEAAVAHFGEAIDIETTTSSADGGTAEFKLTRRA